MAGVTFDFHYRYHYLALTLFACKWLVVPTSDAGGGGPNLDHANNFDSVVFILACLYCKVRVVRTKVWCKMAGVTFDFHYRYHYLALTWFACKWLVVSN
jgi:hypothetical protein